MSCLDTMKSRTVEHGGGSIILRVGFSGSSAGGFYTQGRKIKK